jgi:Ca-activated chloride channel family protein
MLPGDRVSVTTFNASARTIVPNTPADDKGAIVDRIRRVRTGAKTALHAGWAEGGREVFRGRIPDGINRVLLLSDGLANLGLTDPERIAEEVRGMAQKGVGTTTLGVGDEFNEDLMESMARAGGGNYYYIESPDRLPQVFHAELGDMALTTGYRVRLGFEPRDGVEVARVYNDFEEDESGRLSLPNLVAGKSIGVLVRMNVSPQARAGELCRVCLEWDEPRRVGGSSLGHRLKAMFPNVRGRGAGEESDRRTFAAALSLPSVPEKQWTRMEDDPVVGEQVILLKVAHTKRQAIYALDRGDVPRARDLLEKSRLSASSIVATPETVKELGDIATIEAELDQGHLEKVAKRAKFQSWARLSSSSIVASPTFVAE